MSSNVVNQVAFLRTSREFPDKISELTLEVSKSYIDIANAVNNRIISIFPATRPAITGENWFFNNIRQQTLRQVYSFGAIAAGAIISPLIPHGITSLTQFTKIYGTCITDFPDYRPIPYSGQLITNNITVRVDATNIIITNGTTAPNILSGIIVLEWLSPV